MDGPSGKGETKPFSLANLQVNPGADAVSGPKREASLEPKVMAVLVRLAETPGELVSRREFTDSIWATEYGGDESLTRAISLLRKVLARVGAQGVAIETIPRKGYRLVVKPSAGRAGDAKGVRRPLLLLAILVLAFGVLAARWWSSRVAPPTAASPDPVIAVLPFDSQSPVDEDRYVAEGLADEILSALTRTGDVSVIAGNSSFRFRGEDKKDLARIVDELKATHVVDGSVRRASDTLRLGIHLVDTGTGLATWSTVLERPVDEAYTVPDLVARELLGALGRSRISGGQPGAPAGSSAYLAYLEALAQSHQGGDVMKSLSLFEDVAAQSPTFPEAWAKLALTRLEIALARPGPATTGASNRDPDQRLEQAREEAHRALALDPDLTDAHLALAIIDYRARRLSLKEAERRFREVAAEAPNHPNANMRLGMMLAELGRYREALIYLGRAFEIDPLAIWPASLYMQYSLEAGALDQAQQVLYGGRFPWYPSSYTRLIWLLSVDDLEAARDWLAGAREAGHFTFHLYVDAPFPGLEKPQRQRLLELFERLVQVEANGDPASDQSLPRDFVRASDDGLILHAYTAQMLGAVGFREPVHDLVMARLAVDDLFFRGFLFRRSLKHLRADPGVMAWFDATTQLDYWLETDRWPDFCADPALPYDCQEEARRFKGLASAPN